jgi:hypothetical protein
VQHREVQIAAGQVCHRELCLPVLAERRLEGAVLCRFESIRGQLGERPRRLDAHRADGILEEGRRGARLAAVARLAAAVPGGLS